MRAHARAMREQREGTNLTLTNSSIYTYKYIFSGRRTANPFVNLTGLSKNTVWLPPVACVPPYTRGHFLLPTQSEGSTPIEREGEPESVRLLKPLGTSIERCVFSPCCHRQTSVYYLLIYRSTHLGGPSFVTEVVSEAGSSSSCWAIDFRG